MSNASVRISALAVLVFLLSVNAGLAQPAPPETVVAVPYTPEGEQGDPGGFILLSWNAVDGADGYRIWREVLVAQVLDDAGNMVELHTPEDALVVWAVIDVVQPGAVVRAVVAPGNDDRTRWAITTLQQTEAGQLESEPRFPSERAGLALPTPPEAVVAEPYTPEGQGDQGGFLLLSWDAVEEADGYRIWREVLVDRVLDEAGNTVELDTPEDALVVWSVIDVEPGQPVVRAVVPMGDNNTRWAVTTVQDTDDGQQESEPRYFHVQVEGVGTGVQARSWGDVKAGQ